MASEELYPKIGEVVEDDQLMPTVMESLCMNCHEKGETRLLFTEIPFFRQIILMSFRCKKCGFTNNEIKPASTIQEQGLTYTVELTSREDLQRQVIKSDHATFRIEELDFEIPAGKGVLTTVEGLLQTALEELQKSQDDRRAVDPAVADQVAEFITKLALALAGMSFPLHAVLNDPAGNSFFENPNAPKLDPKMKFQTYKRTDEHNAALGLQEDTYEYDDEAAEAAALAEQEAHRKELAKSHPVKEGSTLARDNGIDSTMLENEVFQLPTDCPNCGVSGTSKTCIVDIPFFQEVIIMAFDCESETCGYKTNEIKGGGAIPDKGKVIRLNIPKKSDAGEEKWNDDMKRDVVKSNSAGVLLPELEIEVTAGSLGGMYTTVEGLLALIRDSLFEGQAADFVKGDSATEASKQRFKELEQKFEDLISGEMDFSLEIRDPLGASFVYSPTAPDPEPQLTFEEYERSFEENEDLGLNDMNTEDYDTPDVTEKSAGAKSTQVLADLDHGRFEGPLEGFEGHRPGMVFRLGARGLGYYEDLCRVSEVDAQTKMRNLQSDGKDTHPNPAAVSEF
mmetsp:Transcript_12650/g.22535  ORF Transcript_12650/g.22535 Transcript_12650/m.22535 type:complete len:565 (-) Transcript_12650:37-1731(-)